jgi:hypothetical protein
MDPLTHVFLPLLVAYVIRPNLFRQPQYITLAGLGLLADLDKLIGRPGLLHSLLTLIPICLLLIAVERLIREEIHYSKFALLFTLSHLPLDIIEGVTVPLLFPLLTTGVGLGYPMEVVFGTGPLGFRFQGPPVALEIGELRTGHSASPDVETNTFGFINRFGVASALAWIVAFVGREYSGAEGVGETS